MRGDSPTQAAAFAALLFAALALAPAMAHLLELPNKMDLPREQYLTVQQIYRGWALLAARMRERRAAFRWALAGFGAIAATQAVFWTWAARAMGVLPRRERRAQPGGIRCAARLPPLPFEEP